MQKASTEIHAEMKHIDRPEITEIFVDGVWKAYFDGACVRIEYTVNRLDDAQSSDKPTGTMVTALRLVIPLGGLLQSMQHFNQIITSLQQSGVLRQINIQNPPTAGQPH